MGMTPSSLNESPSEKEGKLSDIGIEVSHDSLNESPSEKEGKFNPLYLSP